MEKQQKTPYTISGLAADKDTADAADLGFRVKGCNKPDSISRWNKTGNSD